MYNSNVRISKDFYRLSRNWSEKGGLNIDFTILVKSVSLGFVLTKSIEIELNYPNNRINSGIGVVDERLSRSVVVALR